MTEPDVEQVLATGGVTDVVRVGNTVRRPARPFTATIQTYLKHLHSKGFHEAPIPLGYDEQGREVLSYVDGDVPQEPLPDYACTDDVLDPLAKLVRRLHDAAADIVGPPDAVWGGIPGTPPGVVPLFETPELVSHQDYCPGNVVFRDGLPAAFIDFDLSRPTTRVADVVNALYWWCPLMHPDDRPPALRNADVPARVRIFADAYGLTSEQRALVVPTAVQRAANSVPAMRAAADADPVFRRWWVGGLEQKLLRAQEWWLTAADPIARALNAPRATS
jgi:hypothetical protein